jgi:hypothetical protein
MKNIGIFLLLLQLDTSVYRAHFDESYLADSSFFLER